ncbi:hypothetical protein Emag_006886 [Eimeria magna]
MSQGGFDLSDALNGDNPPNGSEEPSVEQAQPKRRGSQDNVREWDLRDALGGGEEAANEAGSLKQEKVEGRLGAAGTGEMVGKPIEDEDWDGPFMSRGYIDLGPHFPPSGTAIKRRRLTLGLILTIIVLTSALTALVFQGIAGRLLEDLTGPASQPSEPLFPKEMLEAAARALSTPRADAATQTGEDSSVRPKVFTKKTSQAK